MDRNIRLIVADNIKRAREARGLELTDLARIMEVHRSYPSSVERGMKHISINRLVEFADFLGVPAAKLLEGL